MKKCCTYLRVSTQRQGAQGLGISAQRDMCDRFAKQNDFEITKEFMDVESGTHRDRKGLWDAIDYCKRNGCSLVIAKLDRLARDVEFTFKVINTGIDIHFTDMPIVNSMILGVFASVAQYEREMISKRTKDALAAKKARGEKIGAQSDKWKESYAAKTEEQKHLEGMMKGKTKNGRHMASRDIMAMAKVLRNVFPAATYGDDMSQWEWAKINTTYDNRMRMLSLMKDYRDLDPTLFAKWDLSDFTSKKLFHKLASYLQSIHKAAKTNKMYSEDEINSVA